MNLAPYHSLRYLPSPPEVLRRLLETVDNPQADAAQMEAILRQDQSLTAKLLSLANSAYYSFRNEINTLAQAVVAMGFEEVRSLALAACLVGLMNPRALPDSRTAEGLWLHSLAAAEAGRALAARSGRLAPELGFTAGLLHDLGKVVREVLFPVEAALLRRRLADPAPLSLAQAEAEFGVEHTRLGEELGSFWQLPPTLVEAMAGHHGPERRICLHPANSCVHLADYLAGAVGLGDPSDPAPSEYRPAALPILGLNPNDLATLLLAMEDRRLSVELTFHALVG